MDSIKKTTPSNVSSRRKFVWEAGIFTIIAAVATFMKFPFLPLKRVFKSKPEIKNITMLTQDGKLVQVDEALIKSCRRKANKNELLNWIKK